MTEISEIRKVVPERIVSKLAEHLRETKPNPSAPIGMFDSGVGGLTVLSEVMRILPAEDVICFADTARVPYGGRPPQEIININYEIIDYLVEQGSKLIILACGTSSSIAYPVVKGKYKVPIIGLVGPGCEEAVRATRNGKIGLIATVGTVESGAFQREIVKLRPGTEVHAVGCPLFVPLIEGGFVEAEETKRVAREYLKPLKDDNVDTLILGCTHYPHLKKVIGDIMGPDVTLVDPATQTVLETSRVLKSKGLFSENTSSGNYTYVVSGSAPQYKELGSKLMCKPIAQVKQVSLVAKRAHIE
jgi:glutamate racemase